MTLPWLTQFTLSLPCNINVKVCEGPTAYILWNIFPRKGNIRYICLKRPYLDFHIFFRQFFIRNIWLWKMDLSRKKSHICCQKIYCKFSYTIRYRSQIGHSPSNRVYSSGISIMQILQQLHFVLQGKLQVECKSCKYSIRYIL